MTSEGVSVCEGWAGRARGVAGRMSGDGCRNSNVGSRKSDVRVTKYQLSEIDISILHFGLLITVAPFGRGGLTT
jgi:hypothetical protein